MGRKHTLKQQDPILTNNYKYDKRKRQRLLQRLKLKQQQQYQKNKQKQQRTIQKQVQQQVLYKSTLKKTQPIHKNQSILQQILITNHKPTTKHTIHYKYPQLNFTYHQLTHIYQQHFKINVQLFQIFRQKKQNKSQMIQQKVRKQLRGLFGVEEKQLQGNNNIEEESKQNPYILKQSMKQQKFMQLSNQLLLVSKQFQTQLSHFLIPQQHKNLQYYQKIIYSYTDFIYIENNEQKNISNFRNNLINHSIQHLNQCWQGSKDQGFNKCKILILTPFVGDARALIQLIQQYHPSYKIQNLDKFEEMDDEYDHFRIGITISRDKKKLKYFTKFQFSDIIIASPLALVTASSNEDSQVDFSYLSSVEIVYIDRGSALMMQNWAHCVEVIKNINGFPKYQSLSVDINQIRQSLINLQAKLYRQTIIFSQYNFPQLNSLKFNYLSNWRGMITNQPFYHPLIHSLTNLPQQHFYKIAPKEPKDDLECRLDFFKRKFWDTLHNSDNMNKIVIFVNSYFEFIKLKAFFERVNASAECISQHTKKEKVQSKIAKFNNCGFRILLITERAYYFEVCQIQKFQHLYFYSLPKNNDIYAQLVKSLQKNDETQNDYKVLSIYSKFDSMIIERILGTTKSRQMIKQYCNHVNFVI